MFYIPQKNAIINLLKPKEKFMKKLKNISKCIRCFALILLVLPCMMLFAGCNKTDDLQKQINSLQSQIDALEQANKNNNSSIDTYDLYLQAVESENYQGSYLDFLKDNLTISNDTTALVANKCTASVVSVHAYNSNSSYTNGSGIIYSLDENGNAIVVTNYHVAYSSANSSNTYSYFTLYLYGQDYTKSIPATYVGGSSDYDIAVLQVSESEVLKQSNAQAVSLDTSAAKLGTTCIAIGNPNNDGISITRGVVSRDSELVSMTIAGTTKSRRLIRHDAYITNGSSGGGLFDMTGNLIGVTNGGEKDANHINYAIPASTVYSVVKNILLNCLNSENTNIITCDLGAITVSAGTESIYNTKTGFIDIFETVIFAEISNTSILCQTNEIASGDIITNLTLNKNETSELSKNITRSYEIKEFLLLAKAGDTLTITVSRQNETDTYSTISTTLEINENHLVSFN